MLRVALYLLFASCLWYFGFGCISGGFVCPGYIGLGVQAAFLRV